MGGPGHRFPSDWLGAPGRTRTCDQPLRRRELCPAELRGLENSAYLLAIFELGALADRVRPTVLRASLQMSLEPWNSGTLVASPAE